MKTIVVDAEADNLLDGATRIHVVAVYDPDEDSVLTFVEGTGDYGPFKKFVWGLPHGTRVINHNLIGFDLPLFRKIMGIPYSIGVKDMWGLRDVDVVDTFHLSQFLNADRQGGHSLDNLTKLAGSHKIQYNGGFDEYSENMKTYCIQDVKGTWEVYKMLMKEAQDKYES